MTGFHRPAGAVVELGHGAVVVGLGAATAHLIEAIAQGGLLAAELFDELFVLEMGAAGALIVDGFAIGKQGAATLIEFGQLAQKEVVDHGADEVDGVGWAAWQIHGLQAQRGAQRKCDAGRPQRKP